MRISPNFCGVLVNFDDLSNGDQRKINSFFNRNNYTLAFNFFGAPMFEPTVSLSDIGSESLGPNSDKNLANRARRYFKQWQYRFDAIPCANYEHYNPTTGEYDE